MFNSFYAFTAKALEAKSRVSISSLYKIMDMLCFQIIINRMKDMSKYNRSFYKKALAIQTGSGGLSLPMTGGW